MPFTALYLGNRIDATVIPADLWEELKDSEYKNDLVCRACGSSMIPKTYTSTGTQFFAHKATTGCQFSAGQTKEHLLLKSVVADAVRKAGWTPEFEAFLFICEDTSKSWVDVLAVSPDHRRRVAFEIQWSYQSSERYIQRTERYAKEGVETCWISKRDTQAERYVLNYTLSEGLETVLIDNEDVPIENMVKDVLLEDIIFTNNCPFTIDWHKCRGLECAMKHGEKEYKTRCAFERSTIKAIKERISQCFKWRFPISNDLIDLTFKILNRIARKEALPSVGDAISNLIPNPSWDIENIRGDLSGVHTLADLCRFLWNNNALYKKIRETNAYDPRLDFHYWKCNCAKSKLEICYRIYPNGSRHNVIRCSECHAMHDGSGPSKKRLKPEQFANAKRVEYTKGKGYDYSPL